MGAYRVLLAISRDWQKILVEEETEVVVEGMVRPKPSHKKSSPTFA